ADAFVGWRGDDAASAKSFDLDLGGVRLHGRIDQLYRNGLARFRFDRLHGPSQINHGLDWLVLCALDEGRTLAQFCHLDGEPMPLRRPPVAVAPARAALQALLRLRAWGLREPLPFGPRAGWTWYEGHCRLEAGEKPRANSKTPWQRAHEAWHPEKGYGEGTTASTLLALRGRDPFEDADLGEQLREIAGIVFGAVVHGRDAEAA
ncbi:MAG: exodeoxyribonuclease V subunit gamma, partial [Gammaproteobacteria bacterium]|nr:exodeoxyribonuclease V subunit gamma [Gammaproteobacteria bacterium]